MELQGYALIDRDAKDAISPIGMENFKGKIVRVLEFNREGDVLVIDDGGTGLAMFDKEDVSRSFRCGQVGEVVTPPDLDMMAQMSYVAMAQGRKGGYNRIVRQMVIAASLHREEFCDSLLWAKQ